MKIAIITFSDFNTNFGSILQSLALKTFLESEGHEVTFIRYREFHSHKPDSLLLRIRIFLIRIYYMIYHNERKRRITNFRNFIDANLPHTRLFTSEEDLEMNLESYDAYICGSDQIWNIAGLGGLRTPYFLKFVPKGKIKLAYAPSMGDYTPSEDVLEQIGSLLKSFDAISTRESRSSSIISNLLGKNILTVVDPTLLLSKNQWLQTVGPSDIPTREYAICYFVQRHPLAREMVRFFKNKYKIPIYNVSDNLIHIPGAKNDFIACSPGVFVNLVANAKFCIGASFHLAAFSTIFDKHCYIITTGHNKYRISELFTLVDRIDHMTDGDFDTLPDTKSHIDYSQYDFTVEQSKDFLIKSLGNSRG